MDSNGKTVSGTGAAVETGTVTSTGTVAGARTASEGTATPELPSGVLFALGRLPALLVTGLLWWCRRATWTAG